MSSDIYTPGKNDYRSANSQFTNLLPQVTGAVSGYAPTVSNMTQQTLGQWQANPYRNQAQTGANSASAYGTGTLTPQMQGAATSQFGTGGTAASYVPQALQTGFDPQNALYNLSYGRQIDQQNAINAMNGVSGTPYGAGVTGTVARDFNADWLDRSLGRQATAAGTAGQLAGTAGNAFTTGSNLGTGAINTGVASGALPYGTYTGMLNDTLAALSGANTAVGGAAGATDQVLNTILQYLGYGTSSSQAKAQDANAGWQGIGNLVGAAAPYLIGL